MDHRIGYETGPRTEQRQQTTQQWAMGRRCRLGGQVKGGRCLWMAMTDAHWRWLILRARWPVGEERVWCGAQRERLPPSGARSTLPRCCKPRIVVVYLCRLARTRPAHATLGTALAPPKRLVLLPRGNLSLGRRHSSCAAHALGPAAGVSRAHAGVRVARRRRVARSVEAVNVDMVRMVFFVVRVVAG